MIHCELFFLTLAGHFLALCLPRDYLVYMSQSRELDEDTDMAISYTNPSAGHQTLPSFREVRYKLYKTYINKILIPTSFSPLTSMMKSTQPHHTTHHHAHKTAQAQATKWTPAQSHTEHPNPKCHTTHTANTLYLANEWTPATRCVYPTPQAVAQVPSSLPSETWTPSQPAQ